MEKNMKKANSEEKYDNSTNNHQLSERFDAQAGSAGTPTNSRISKSVVTTSKGSGAASKSAGSIATHPKVADSNATEVSDKEIDVATSLLASLQLPVLSEATLDGICKYINDKPNLKIITMVGAGISTAAGIPDFRSPNTGIYANLKKYNLPYTNAIFELDYFVDNPEPFYHLASEIFPGSYKATRAHYFIRLLQEKNLLLRHYTQNIDNLDRLAGIAEDKLIEAHGTFNTSHCLNCGASYPVEWLQAQIKRKAIPKCSKCDGLVKPDIVFFGEVLPRKFYENLSDFAKCDLLIIMGSSLAVEPFASLASRVPRTCPRLLINATAVGSNLGFTFSSSSNQRDVLWLGQCDEGCLLLCDKLGWKQDLEELIPK